MSAAYNNILILGGTGHYGQQVSRRLLAKNVNVNVLSRSPERASQLLGDTCRIFKGDATDRTAVRHALEDMDAVIICLSAVSPSLIRRIKEIEQDAVIMIMEEAEKAGVKRLVYFSGYEMRPDILKKLRMTDFGAIKIDIESRIKNSDFNWTILGCAPSFELFFTFLRNNRLVVPGGGYNPVPSISSDDVGEIAAQAVVRDDLSGIRFRLTGPQAFTFPQVADLFSEILGKKIKHMAIPLPIINIVSGITYPFNPFIRYIYKSIKLFNNFPNDLAARVPEDHRTLHEYFKYSSVSLENAAKKRLV